MSSSEAPLSWRASLLETVSALLAVIVADSLENIAVYGPYYVLGLFSVIVIGVLPATILAARKKAKLLKEYKHSISQFSVWLAAILVTNIFVSAWNVFKIAPSIGTVAIGVFFIFVLFATRLLNSLTGMLGQASADSSASSGWGKRFSRSRAFTRTLIIALAFTAGVAVTYAVGFRTSIDPLWVSILVAVALVIATLALMRENRLFRLEAVKPAFGFEFGMWPPGGVPHMWNLKNSGGLARALRIDIKQGNDTTKLFVPSCGRDELVQLGQDFRTRYDQGGKLVLDLQYRDTYRRTERETLEIDFDDLKSSGRSLPYSFTHVAALEEIVEELRRLSSTNLRT